ncbi:MAG: type IX secretion system membrane protein PorP/SprF, partial [Bacteroidia bacterium]
MSLFFQKTQAQQQPQYTQYMYNTMSINSGYVGSTESLDAFLLHRSQWVGMDGAPKTT